MREDLEKQEQMQNLKAFWETNGKWIIGVATFILIGLIFFNAWKFWQTYKKDEASKILLSVEKNLDAQNIDVVSKLIDKIFKEHSGTLQAGLAGLMAAKAFLSGGNQEEAESVLRNLVDNQHVEWLARIRLSGLLLDLNRPGEILNQELIPKDIPESWLAIALDRRGDAHAAMGDFNSARRDWEKALQSYSDFLRNQAAIDFVSRKLATLNASNAK
jgi:predicted negative regulator of RcsB-dependent stress response